MMNKVSKLPIDIGSAKLNLSLNDDQFPKQEGKYEVRHIVRAIVLDEFKLAFCQLKRNDDIAHLDYIETSGGGVEKDENLLQALARELKEELGLVIDPICYLGKIEDDYNVLKRHNCMDYFLVRSIGKCESSKTSLEKEMKMEKVLLTYEEAKEKYLKAGEKDRLGRLVMNRELPVLELAFKVMCSYGLN